MALAAALSALGLAVLAPTADWPTRMVQLMNMGVDGIVTDRPDLLFTARLNAAQSGPGANAANRRSPQAVRFAFEPQVFNPQNGPSLFHF